MRLTKLEHACVRLEKDGVILVIDPAAWSMPRALEGASAVLVTHEHFDHFDADRLRAALTADPGLQLWTNDSVASEFAGFSKDQLHIVDDGDAFSVAGFDVHAYGHLHAVLHRDIPVIANTGSNCCVMRQYFCPSGVSRPAAMQCPYGISTTSKRGCLSAARIRSTFFLAPLRLPSSELWRNDTWL